MMKICYSALSFCAIWLRILKCRMLQESQATLTEPSSALSLICFPYMYLLVKPSDVHKFAKHKKALWTVNVPSHNPDIVTKARPF